MLVSPLLTKPKKDNNQSDFEFDMEVFECTENTNILFGRRHNIEEGNKKLYSLFTDQCDTYLKTNLKE